jgi:lysozyme family protein
MVVALEYGPPFQNNAGSELMASTPFESSLPFILRWEGGFVDHPNDPGGRTNKGVTQRVYTSWLARRGLSHRDVKTITDAEVKAIYEADYWLPPRCDQLPVRLDLVQFDTAVNMGVRRAVRFLQGALDCGVDGQFGPATTRAVAECDARTTLAGYCDIREAYYRRLAVAKPELQVFLRGWMNRLNSLRKEVGLLTFGFAEPVSRAEAGAAMRIPDLGEDASFDL